MLNRVVIRNRIDVLSVTVLLVWPDINSKFPAFLCAVALQLTVFVLALRSMVSFDLPSERVEEILGHCGISSSRIVPRGD